VGAAALEVRVNVGVLRIVLAVRGAAHGEDRLGRVDVVRRAAVAGASAPPLVCHAPHPARAPSAQTGTGRQRAGQAGRGKAWKEGLTPRGGGCADLCTWL
jgi:hypothetical protein